MVGGLPGTEGMEAGKDMMESMRVRYAGPLPCSPGLLMRFWFRNDDGKGFDICPVSEARRRAGTMVLLEEAQLPASERRLGGLTGFRDAAATWRTLGLSLEAMAYGLSSGGVVGLGDGMALAGVV